MNKLIIRGASVLALLAAFAVEATPLLTHSGQDHRPAYARQLGEADVAECSSEHAIAWTLPCMAQSSPFDVRALVRAHARETLALQSTWLAGFWSFDQGPTARWIVSLDRRSDPPRRDVPRGLDLRVNQYSVPEPQSVLLLGVGLLAMWLLGGTRGSRSR